jgi:hypothetical protein
MKNIEEITPHETLLDISDRTPLLKIMLARPEIAENSDFARKGNHGAQADGLTP